MGHCISLQVPFTQRTMNLHCRFYTILHSTMYKWETGKCENKTNYKLSSTLLWLWFWCWFWSLSRHQICFSEAIEFRFLVVDGKWWMVNGGWWTQKQHRSILNVHLKHHFFVLHIISIDFKPGMYNIILRFDTVSQQPQ